MEYKYEIIYKSHLIKIMNSSSLTGAPKSNMWSYHIRGNASSDLFHKGFLPSYRKTHNIY